MAGIRPPLVAAPQCAGRRDARHARREGADRRRRGLHLSASTIGRLALLIDPGLAAAFRIRVAGAAVRQDRDPTACGLVSCAVNSLEKSGELGKDPSADLVQMNGLGFWFHSATHERMCFSSAWTER
jgi:hypothetical protein